MSLKAMSQRSRDTFPQVKVESKDSELIPSVHLSLSHDSLHIAGSPVVNEQILAATTDTVPSLKL